MSHQSSGQYQECGKPSIKSSCDTSDREGSGGPGGGREATAYVAITLEGWIPS